MKIDIDTLRKTKGIGDKTLERIIAQHKKDNDIKSFQSEYLPSDKYKVNQDINLWQGDCLELMSHIPDKSIDMILCDLPYGTTTCSWDEIIPFEPLWSHYERIVKDNGAILLFNDEKFGTKLKDSNFQHYKYDWIWVKTKPSNFALANIMPMKYHEFISVFYQHTPIYNKQYISREGGGSSRHKYITDNSNRTIQGTNKIYGGIKQYDQHKKNPSTVLKYTQGRPQDCVHPTQKPVELLEYLIKTYTNENMVVLDNTMGSGSTGVACQNLNRKFIGMELDNSYYNIAKKRILENN